MCNSRRRHDTTTNIRILETLLIQVLLTLTPLPKHAEPSAENVLLSSTAARRDLRRHSNSRQTKHFSKFDRVCVCSNSIAAFWDVCAIIRIASVGVEVGIKSLLSEEEGIFDEGTEGRDVGGGDCDGWLDHGPFYQVDSFP